MIKKLIAFGVITAIGWFFWNNLSLLIENPVEAEKIIWIAAVLFFILLVSVLSNIFLIFAYTEQGRSEKRIEKLVLLSGLFAGFFTVFDYNGLYFGAFALSALIFYAAIGRFESESGERFKINVYAIVQRAGRLIITSIFIMISFAYFLSPAIQNTAKSTELPPAIEKITVFVVGSFLKDQQNVSSDLLKQAEREVLKQVNGLLKPYYGFLPPIFAFGLFLILQGFSFAFIWLSALASAVLFWILKKNGIIKIEKVQKEAESIKF